MVAPFKALWYNHYMLAYSFTVQLFLIIVLSPVAAHLFFATKIPFSKHIEVQQLSKFSKNGFNHDSLQPVLDIVSSTLIYGGRPIAWTTLTEALLPIQVPRPKDTNSGARNLTVSNSALKATLDCEVLSSSEFELQEVLGGQPGVHTQAGPGVESLICPNLRLPRLLRSIWLYPHPRHRSTRQKWQWSVEEQNGRLLHPVLLTCRRLSQLECKRGSFNNR